jgi:sortase A
VTFGANSDVKSMAAAMTNGVAHYSISGASAIPGEIGNFAVSGHSAGNVYETSQYKFIFSGLTRLTNGDLIYMDYNGTRYSYRVTGANTVEPSDSAALRRIANENPGKPMITLITCTPLGTSKYRLLVYGEQIHPSVNDDTATQAPAKESDSDTQTMPKNSDSPLEQFWKWLTGQE